MRRALVTAALVLALAGCGAAPEGPRVVVPGAPGEPAQIMDGAEVAQRRSPVPVSPADVEFVERMVPHHEQALEMAVLAPARAADPGVRAMAERIAGVQGPEIAVLESWLARQDAHPAHGDHGDGGDGGDGGDHTGMPGMATPAQLTDLATATGPAFDRLFVTLMIAHHQGALTMAGQVRTAGTDLLVAEFADDVVATQSADIDRLRGLLQ
ncbi:DUF305 domain-containing protein [Pseudonocardia abyssalis]|uniref:DUF305 domain-containing protein n=2 Tax=Pseudonocardia abyssalis TaxID=2792008 RepID=A0ABS6UQS8_9PSEU|nr:DUF305 domain-containing protein [Pseudonocardia abyssalis]MBW0134291.1 DUF305 domain-containing protein [Pseudonocardia abyssalis]